MAKPIIKKVTPFDVNKGTEIEIMWTGERATAHRVMIYDNATDELVYDEKVTTYSLKHVIAPNPNEKFVNGGTWYMRVQVYDQTDTASVLSDKVLFYTFNTPSFWFVNENGEKLVDGYTIEKSSYQANVYYESIDGEKISSYEFYIYDNTKHILLQTNKLNDADNIVYTYRGLTNNAQYYLQCKGTTINGMELDTGLVTVNIVYSNQTKYAMVYAEPLVDQGCVQISSNIKLIQYNGTEVFQYEDGLIDLRNKILYYDDGFEVDNDFSIAICGKNLWQTDRLIRMSNGVDSFEISSRIYTDNTLRFRLLVFNGVSNYIVYSDPINKFSNENFVTVLIKRQGSLYDIESKIDS